MITSTFELVRLGDAKTVHDEGLGWLGENSFLAAADGNKLLFVEIDNKFKMIRMDDRGEPIGSPVDLGISSYYGASATSLSNGNIIVAYHGADGVMGQVFSADLTPVGGAIMLVEDGLYNEAPTIAATADGGFVVVQNSGDGFDEWRTGWFDAARYDGDGILVSSFMREAPSGYSTSDPTVAVGVDGTICIAWSESRFWNYTWLTHTRFETYDPDMGTRISSKKLVGYDPNVVAHPDGGFIISTSREGVADRDINTVRITNDGVIVDTDVTGSVGQNYSPAAAVSGDGYTVIASELNRYGDGDIAASILTPDGTVVALDVLLEGGDGAQFSPAVSWLDPSTVLLASQAGSQVSLSRFGVVHTQTGDGTGQVLQGDGLIDAMRGLGGSDTLLGGDGNDTLDGGDGADHLYGGLGADRLVGGDAGGVDFARYDDANYGNLVVHLGASDRNTGAAAGDTYVGIEGVVGGAGNDQISGNKLNNMLAGRGGNDVLIGGAGDDNLAGALGNDRLRGDAGSDTLAGGAGGDEHIGGAGIDYAAYDDANWGNLVISLSNAALNTGAAAGDTYVTIEGVIGGLGNDSIYGTSETDHLIGGGGVDQLFGGLGDDRLEGGEGGDGLYGGAGADLHIGGAGAGVDYARYDDTNWGDLVISLTDPSSNTGVAAGDTYVSIEGIIGGRGNDKILGDAARNVLQGGSGNDIIDGLDGSDVLVGQIGADKFSFSTALGTNNIDTINGFEHGIDDIQLSRAMFKGVGPALDTAEFGTAPGAGKLIVYNQATGELSFDAGGAGAGADSVVFAIVANKVALDIHDFVMIA